MQVAEGKIISIHYTLTNTNGEVLDSSKGKEPLDFMQGKGHIIKGLENALDGKEKGDKLNVTIPPEDGYGVRNDQLIQTVSKSAFEGVEEIKPGMQFQAQTPNGVQLIIVKSVDGEEVTVDLNHPLAGETLVFDVEVSGVRVATAEEQEHGHPHASGGCSCC